MVCKFNLFLEGINTLGSDGGNGCTCSSILFVLLWVAKFIVEFKFKLALKLLWGFKIFPKVLILSLAVFGSSIS